MNTFIGDIRCEQKNSPQSLCKGMRAANKNISFGEIIITNPQEILKEKLIPAATRNNAVRTLTFWLFSILGLSEFMGLRFPGWFGLEGNVEDKLLPHDYDSEGMLLAALFCPGGMQKVAGLISADDFYSESGKLIFGKMMEFHESGRGFTISIVDQVFEEHPQYIDIRRALDMLVPVTAETATHFAKIVRELADRRGAIKASYEVFENLFDLSIPIHHVRGFLRVEVPGLAKEVLV